MTNSDKKYLMVHPEVEHALIQGKPVVALESTVITHGLPFPENIQLANDLEKEIRKQSCVPATIAIIDGVICVGLDSSQMDKLVHAINACKVSVRDIASAVQKGLNGGTTVAGTLAIAEMAGIKVFATGGIGGVHREAAYDVSADLIQLSRSKVVVVCAGAKAILDIPATLEMLETNGVPVVGYKTDDFPAFYSVSSGMPVSVRVDSAEEAAELARMHWELGFTSSVLVTVPPPVEDALAHEEVDQYIHEALDEMRMHGIRGQAVTPFLLRRVSELSGERSLKANLGLLRNNARVAGEIAIFMI